VDLCEAKRGDAKKITYRSLSARLLHCQEEEVTRIKRELHDHLGQLLFAIGMDVSWARDHCAEEMAEVGERLQETARIVEETILATRELSVTLRSEALNWGSLGLEEVLNGYAVELTQQSGIPIHFVSYLTTIEELAPEAATHISRIVREALLNVIHHAAATAVTVELQRTERELVVSVRDNGKGFAVAQVSDPQAFGLVEMQERAGLIGGWLEVCSAPGEGTSVRLHVPRREGRMSA
jgi:signal transduction histidine kinase